MKSNIYSKSVKFKNKSYGRIQVKQYHQDLIHIGSGRSACVFRIKDTNKVIKVFPPRFMNIAKEEAEIYQLLAHIPYYPTVYEYGPNYIVMEYVDGHTLFDCLNKGITISKEQIQDVDYILSLAVQVGLNPSDIHLRNILITADNKVKIIDVARFKQEKNCQQWNDIRTAYFRYYNKRFFPKRIPQFILNMIAALYKNNLIPDSLK
ncbi:MULTISPECIES: protein kinase domain-containing protein [Bacillus]|uniref:protein kinase domain-containing protein n=1 Tax=Bacillus TaxID=1386 RepID=UPI0002D4CE55|nr:MULTISPECIES: hypothetical protein [Bacillus]